MTGCIIIGDCIALGIAAYASFMIPGGCDHQARVGAATAEIARMAPQRHAQVVFVSAGSNDADNADLGAQLAGLRARVRADRVVWLYPRASAGAWAVYKVARAYGDRTVSLAHLPSKDGAHPKDYRAAAALVFLGNRR